MTDTRVSNTPGSGRALGVVSFLSLMLLFILLLTQLFLQYLEFEYDKDVLNSQLVSQQPAVRKAETVRSQLESIAGSTAVLARQGNVNAILIRDQLKSQGINIKAPNSP